jgi:hypothetical protein
MKPTKRRKPPAGQKGRGWRYKGENNLDYKGKRSQMNVMIPDDLLITLKRHHQSDYKNISFNDYMTKVVKDHLQFLSLKTVEAYDYSDPDLDTYIESLQHV